MDDKIVQFRIKRKKDAFDGYMFLKDAYIDNPLHFYDYLGRAAEYVPINVPIKENKIENSDFKKWENNELLIKSIREDGLLIKYLVDFADETNKIIDRDGYKVIINPPK